MTSGNLFIIEWKLDPRYKSKKINFTMNTFFFHDVFVFFLSVRWTERDVNENGALQTELAFFYFAFIFFVLAFTQLINDKEIVSLLYSLWSRWLWDNSIALWIMCDKKFSHLDLLSNILSCLIDKFSGAYFTFFKCRNL